MSKSSYAGPINPQQSTGGAWQQLPSSQEHLHGYLRDMYWTGVKHEILLILLTLKEWQLPKYDSVVLQDEVELSIHGYDTFIDQINKSSRDFAERYGQ